jgi:hypothetical protein
MATDTAEEPRWRIVAAPELQGARRRMAPKGILWAKLQRMEATLRLIQAQTGDAPQERAFIAYLLDRLEMARASITKVGRDGEERPRILVNSTLYWSLLHEVTADTMLIMPAEMLAAEARHLVQQFKRNIIEPDAREAWLGKDGSSGPLHEALRVVEACAMRPGAQSAEDALKLRHARHVLRSVRREVDNHTDLAFQRLNLTVLIRGMSGILLVLLFSLAFLFNSAMWLSPIHDEAIWHSLARLLPLIMLGAGGAIVANMTSEMSALVTNGPRWRQFIFYLFVRPALGAFAAFLFCLLAWSGMIFSIEVAEAATAQSDPALPPAIRIVLGSARAVGFAYAMISIVVGFSAERILGSTMDKVLHRLFSAAEKTIPTPGGAPVGSEGSSQRGSSS